MILKLIDEKRLGHRLLERFLTYLVRKRGVLPIYLFVSGVRRIGRNPAFGGGFADVWKGDVREALVALKVLRIFEHNEERNKVHQVPVNTSVQSLR